jgi:hypothetical protein
MRHFLKIIISLSLVIFATSCHRDRIPDGKMAKIIADLYLADGYMNLDFKLVQRADTSVIYENIIQKYGYDKVQFVNTINHHVSRPGKLKLIYLEAQQILMERKNFLDAEIANRMLTENVSEIVRPILNKLDSGKVIDSYQRSVRWISYPDRFAKWSAAVSDSVAIKFESPLIGNWWLNNFRSNTKPFYKYEKNSSTIPLPAKDAADPQRLSIN